MPVDREITKPSLGEDQEPQTIAWKNSLRSASPSPRATARSRSRTRSDDLGNSLRTRTPSPGYDRSLNESISNLRRSRSGKLSSSLAKSAELKEIENDYIKNLQQQIYFLELEANHLRDQAKKATMMHPQMTAEAERMLTKLRALQSQVDGLNVEIRRKDASIHLMSKEKSKALSRLAEEENEKERMKRTLLEEIAQIKSERDSITLDNTRLDNQVSRLSEDKDVLSIKLREAQNTISRLRNDLDEKQEHLNTTKLNLEEKRSQCIAAEMRAKEVEDHYHTNTKHAHEKQVCQLRDELHLLKTQLKEVDRQAADERFMKNKKTLENDDLKQTTERLQNEIDDLNLQLSKEYELRSAVEEEHTNSRLQVSRLSDKEKELELELRSTRQELMEEKARGDRFLSQIRKQEETNSNLETVSSSLNKQLANAEATISVLKRENESLRKDKEILTDHVADLQSQLAERSQELLRSSRQIQNLADDLEAVETEKRVDETLQSERWREFESLAENMKKLSRTMARTSPSKSPRSSARFS